MNDAVAVALGLAAAACFAGSAVAQQRVAATQAESKSLRPRLLISLMHRRTWMLGTALMVVAYAFQATALGVGNVALVQPLIATELLFAIPLAVSLKRRRPGVAEWIGAALVAGGVAVFLLAASPVAGHHRIGTTTWLAVLAPSAGAIGGMVLLARGPQTRARAMLLGAASGAANGIVAIVTRSFTVEVGRLGIAALASWQPLTIAAFGALAFLCAQSAFQAAPLSTSLPLIDSVEPISAIVLGAAVLGEHLDVGLVHLCSEAAGAIAAGVGVAMLARSPVVLSIYEQQQRAREPDDRVATVARYPERHAG